MDLALEDVFAQTKRYDYPLTCVFRDIDHFKQINDTHGHSVGNFVLLDLSGLLLETRRRTDSCYRYGGEEFVVLLPHTPLSGGEVFAERLLDRIRNHAFVTDDLSLRITVSLGFAGYQRDEIDTPDRLLKCAINALSEAKNTGRDRFSIWQTDVLPSER